MKRLLLEPIVLVVVLVIALYFIGKKIDSKKEKAKQ